MIWILKISKSNISVLLAFPEMFLDLASWESLSYLHVIFCVNDYLFSDHRKKSTKMNETKSESFHSAQPCDNKPTDAIRNHTLTLEALLKDIYNNHKETIRCKFVIYIHIYYSVAYHVLIWGIYFFHCESYEIFWGFAWTCFTTCPMRHL